MLDTADKAAEPPQTDDWLAVKSDYQAGTVTLLVSGKVEVTSANKEPKLTAAFGGGSTLILDLTVETGDDPGADVLVWKPVTFSRRVGADEFHDVDVRWEDKVIGSCKVVDDDEAHARAVVHTAAENAKASMTMTAGKVKKTARAVLDAVGKAASSNAGKVAVGTAAVAAVGAAAVMTAVSLSKPKAKKKVAKKASTKAAAKSAKKAKAKAAPKSKTKSKAKSKAKPKSKTKVRSKTKVKAKSKAKTKSAPKKAAKRVAKKTKRAKSRR